MELLDILAILPTSRVCMVLLGFKPYKQSTHFGVRYQSWVVVGCIHNTKHGWVVGNIKSGSGVLYIAVWTTNCWIGCTLYRSVNYKLLEGSMLTLNTLELLHRDKFASCWGQGKHLDFRYTCTLTWVKWLIAPWMTTWVGFHDRDN